jgi:TonB family protein
MSCRHRLLSVWLLLVLPPAALFAQRVAPERVTTPTPHYPKALADTGRDGTATIEFTVDVDGSVKDPSVKSADHPEFAAAAIAVLPGWKFKPGMRDGKPIAMKVSLPFSFRAPPEQKINAMFKRKVYVELPQEPIPAKELKEPLEPIAMPKIPYPQTHVGSGKTETVEMEYVVTPSGETVNPVATNEVDPEFIAVAILYTAGLVYPPPKQDGKPVYVHVTRTLRIAEETGVQ